MRAAARDEGVREAIARSIVSEACGERSTLLAHLVAAAFADRVIDAHNGQGFLQVVMWTERTCRRYAAFPTIAALLRAACGVTQRELRRRNLANASLESDLLALEGTIAGKLAELIGSKTVDTADRIDETIAAFLIKLDEADPLTAEHSRAVALWCRRLARRLALPEERGVFVRRGGLLHDVGKTLTPKEILLAPRALTFNEYAVIQDHAASGARMVRDVEALAAFEPLVGSHHERIDGKGYPAGLKGKAISLDVRIVTVADCFNAMIGRRPYRAPLSPAVALDQLVKHRGTQFDPDVVDAMIDVVEHPD